MHWLRFDAVRSFSLGRPALAVKVGQASRRAGLSHAAARARPQPVHKQVHLAQRLAAGEAQGRSKRSWTATLLRLLLRRTQHAVPKPAAAPRSPPVALPRYQPLASIKMIASRCLGLSSARTAVCRVARVAPPALAHRPASVRCMATGSEASKLDKGWVAGQRQLHAAAGPQHGAPLHALRRRHLWPAARRAPPRPRACISTPPDTLFWLIPTPAARRRMPGRSC